MGALCLSTRNNDYVLLLLPGGDVIRIDVEMDIYHRKAKLHFDAPPAVRIWRGEVWERIQAEKDEPISPELGGES